MEHPIEGLMNAAMHNIKDMIDVNTVVGEPITTADGTTIIPISKVTIGFASGGSEFPAKVEKMPFGGGSGGGISIAPTAFLIVSEGNVKLLQIGDSATATDKLVDLIPETIDKISALFKKNKTKEDVKDGE